MRRQEDVPSDQGTEAGGHNAGPQPAEPSSEDNGREVKDENPSFSKDGIDQEAEKRGERYGGNGEGVTRGGA
jgi:hypothetical protein